MRFAAVLLTTTILAAAPSAWADDAASDSIWERANLLGDLGGVRPWAADHGVTLTFTEQDEMKANASGGLKRGATVNGQTMLGAQIIENSIKPVQQ